VLLPDISNGFCMVLIGEGSDFLAFVGVDNKDLLVSTMYQSLGNRCNHVKT